jgi:hypothetical protein
MMIEMTIATMGRRMKKLDICRVPLGFLVAETLL